MQFTPYLNFDGNCAEAFAFYAKLFGASIVHQSTFAEVPPSADMPPLPESAKGRIMHVQLQLKDQSLMGSDAMPTAPRPGPRHLRRLPAAAGPVGVAAGRRRGRGPALVRRPGPGRTGRDALCRHVLVTRLWHGARPLRHALDGQCDARGLSHRPR